MYIQFPESIIRIPPITRLWLVFDINHAASRLFQIFQGFFHRFYLPNSHLMLIPKFISPFVVIDFLQMNFHQPLAEIPKRIQNFDGHFGRKARLAAASFFTSLPNRLILKLFNRGHERTIPAKNFGVKEQLEISNSCKDANSVKSSKLSPRSNRSSCP